MRMNALLNRTAKPKASTKERFIFDNYLFNNTLQELALGDDVVKLSFRESALLKMLMEHKNQVLDRRMALDSLWGGDSFFNARSMDVFISKLRKHLKKDDTIEIVNVRGIGYKLIVEE